MSPGQRSALTWGVIILLAAYLMDANLTHIISSFLNALQQIHNSNAH